jgi:hypothetical protein
MGGWWGGEFHSVNHGMKTGWDYLPKTVPWEYQDGIIAGLSHARYLPMAAEYERLLQIKSGRARLLQRVENII